MILPPLPVDEDDRLSALKSYCLDNISAEPAFGRLAAIVAESLEVPIAYLSFVENKSCNIIGAVGLPTGPGPREVAFCGYTILGNPLVVPDALLDERFVDNPHVLGPPHIRFFAGVPVRALGQPVGTLSIIDTTPRDLSGPGLRKLQGLARTAEDLIQFRLGNIRHAAAERRLESIIESNPVAMAVYDAQDRLLLSNGRYRETFLGSAEVKLDALITLSDLFDRIAAGGRRIWIEGQTVDWKTRRMELRREGVSPYYIQIDGQQWLLCHETRTEAGELVASFADVTALKEREAVAAEQAAVLRTTLENIDQGLALFDSGRRLVACSKAYFDLFDVSPKLRRNGTRLETMIHDLARRGVVLGREAGGDLPRPEELLRDRGTRRFELRLDGGRVLSTTMAALDDGRLVVTCLDITERKEVERLKDEFVSTVSHELRTPLTSIAGSLGLMAAGATGELPPAAARLVGIAHRNTDRLTRLVNDLLDIDKVESGQMQFELKRIDLNVLAVQAVEQSHPLAERVNVAIEARTAPKPILVEGDVNRLLQVADNLVSNAIKYSAPGQSVTVTVGLKGERACLSVIDRGPGIPEEFRSQMFRRFSQADASDRRSQEGSGLGLAIALAICHRHGGTISYESTIGIGTRFDLELPLADSSALPDPSGAGVQCLVCQGDELASDRIRHALEQAGLTVEIAQGLEAALSAIHAQLFEVLVTDLLLPDGDGFDLVRRARALRNGNELAVVVTASRPDPRRNSVETVALNILDWIEGDLDINRLTSAVERRGRFFDRALRVLHVEDAADLSQVVAIALGSTAGVDLATDLETARLRLVSKEYDVVILDIALPDGSALDLLPMIAAGPHPPAVVIFSGIEPSSDVSAMVHRVLMKSRSGVTQLAETVREIARERHG
ncbi:response regulator receiver domain-containing protein [Silicimonas algicola]|uniref:histidine kinase n=2 Tax=Silicimonas algicola TaxID=1826607 RepID=A0A316G3T7_9RHOB|nr:ATP-binding protein [Silicimonas algicola]PWK54985.1 response regulator receiver domain-containing protein [Silicimonas algicola]